MSWFHEDAKYFKENGEVDLIKEALCGDVDPHAEIVDNVVYTTVTEKGRNGKEHVKAMVVITELIKEGDSYVVGCCPMLEDAGPAPTKCPESILKLLTPTRDPIAQGWREECWEYARIKAKLKSK